MSVRVCAVTYLLESVALKCRLLHRLGEVVFSFVALSTGSYHIMIRWQCANCTVVRIRKLKSKIDMRGTGRIENGFGCRDCLTCVINQSQLAKDKFNELESKHL